MTETRTHFDYFIENMDPDMRAPLPVMSEICLEIFRAHIQEELQFSPEEEVPNNHLTASKVLFGMIGQFIRCGRQVFSLGPAMTEMLAETSTDNIKKEDIHFPYDNFWVSFPPGTMTISDAEVTEGSYTHGDVQTDAWGMYVANLLDGVIIVVWGAGGGKGEGYQLWAPLAYGLLKEGDTIESCITGRKVGIGSAVGAVTASSAIVKIKKAVRIAFNLMLYLNSDGAEEVKDDILYARAAKVDRRYQEARHLSVSKQRKIVTKLSKKKQCRVRYIAPTIETSMTGTIARHWVRGHWHTYLVGKGRSKRLLKWVMPYEKCMDKESRTDTREYTVGESNGKNSDKHEAEGK